MRPQHLSIPLGSNGFQVQGRQSGECAGPNALGGEVEEHARAEEEATVYLWGTLGMAQFGYATQIW